MSEGFHCRSCGAALTTTFVDLGAMPLANDYIEPDAPIQESYPLHAWVCEACLLVQIHHAATPEQIFSDYAYFSSFADSWNAHAEQFVAMASERFITDPDQLVVEVASNDGYLLQHFVARGVRSLGIEPAANVAEAAVQRGVPTLVEFFGEAVAGAVVAEHGPAQLVIANNVLAHVPDLNDFVAGLARVLADGGTLTVEFPHLLHLIEEVQFDTIYHEHFSYFSLLAVEAALGRHGLVVVDVEQQPTHGGSLRLLARHGVPGTGDGAGLLEVRELERRAGLDRLETYAGFGDRVAVVRASVRAFFEQARAEGATVVGYGAAAKGNTLLNTCGITARDLPFVVDRNPRKQGRLLPGSRIPVVDPAAIDELRPDYVLILPWNLADEITGQMARIRAWGGRFLTPVPEVRILP